MIALGDLSPAERHRVIAEGFAQEALWTADWDAQSPVEAWVARDVVAHLLDWFPGFLAGGGVELAPTPLGDDPAAAWTVHAERVQELFARGDVEFSHPMIGTLPLAEAVDRFYTADVFMHTWDLAQSGGRRPDLDEAYAERILAEMMGMEEVLRASGQYGPPVPAPSGADAVVRLAAFIGREPVFAED